MQRERAVWGRITINRRNPQQYRVRDPNKTVGMGTGGFGLRALTKQITRQNPVNTFLSLYVHRICLVRLVFVSVGTMRWERTLQQDPGTRHDLGDDSRSQQFLPACLFPNRASASRRVDQSRRDFAQTSWLDVAFPSPPEILGSPAYY